MLANINVTSEAPICTLSYLMLHHYTPKTCDICSLESHQTLLMMSRVLEGVSYLVREDFTHGVVMGDGPSV